MIRLNIFLEIVILGNLVRRLLVTDATSAKRGGLGYLWVPENLSLYPGGAFTRCGDGRCIKPGTHRASPSA